MRMAAWSKRLAPESNTSLPNPTRLERCSRPCGQYWTKPNGVRFGPRDSRRGMLTSDGCGSHATLCDTLQPCAWLSQRAAKDTGSAYLDAIFARSGRRPVSELICPPEKSARMVGVGRRKKKAVVYNKMSSLGCSERECRVRENPVFITRFRASFLFSPVKS